VYADRDLPDTLALRAAGALLLPPPGSVLSHRTAAELRDLPLPARRDEVVHALVPGRAGQRIQGIRAHGSREPIIAETVRGLPLATPARIWCDLAPALGRRDLAILGDAILAGGRTTGAELEKELACVRRGGPLAREVLPLLEPRVASPMETRLRLLLVDAGLPRPVVNWPVFDAAGGWIAVPDLQYPRQKVAIEYEGAHHLTRGQLRRDIRRDELYRDEGWILIKVTYEDLVLRPDALVDRIRRAISR
jgi:hypothetical protein